MAGVSFRIQDQELEALLARVDRVAERPVGALHAIGAHFVFSTQRNIETETAPDGTRWPPLSPRTANRRIGRRLRGYDHMLRVTNRLYGSISYAATDRAIEWGSNLEYARIHQLGGTISIPERTGTVHLARIRQKGGGVRTRFVRRDRKNAEERQVRIGSHQIRVPARPYLGISDSDRAAVPEIIADYLRTEVVGR